MVDKFRDLYVHEGLRPSQAIERFMELLNENSVEGLLHAAEKRIDIISERDEAKAWALVDWIENGDRWVYPKPGE